VGLLMAGEECCFQEVPIEIQPEDYKVAVTGNLFDDNGESAQDARDKKREEERQRKREEAAKRAEERKEKQKGFLSGIMKKIKSVGENFEKEIGVFLSDDDKDDNNK